MNELNNFTEFDQKMYAAMQVPAPSPEFVSGLWSRIENQPPRQHPRPAFLPPLPNPRRWAVALAVFILFFITFLAFGPSRVVAALKAFLNYIPGIGYVNDNSTMRIVKPYEQTIDEVTISVPAGVVDGQKTVIRFNYSGIALPAPGMGDPVDLCMEWPRVILPDGSELSGVQGMAGTEDHVTVEGYQSFASIPSDTNSFDLVFPCLMNAEKISSPKNITLRLQLEPMPPDYPVYEVIDLSTPPPSAPAGPGDTSAEGTEQPSIQTNAIHFSVDRLAEMSDGFLFEGSLSWPTDAYRSVNLWTFDIKVVDAGGREVEIQEAAEQGLAEYTEGRLEWAVRTSSKDFTFPLTFHLPVVNVTQNRRAAPLQIDLGDHPSVGQNWKLDYQYTFEGLPITVGRATLVKLPGGFSNDLYLNLEGESPIGNDASLSFKPDEVSTFPSCGVVSGGGGGGGGMDSSGNGGSFSTLVFLGCQPHGKINLLLTSVTYDLAGGWSAIVDPATFEIPREESR